MKNPAILVLFVSIFLIASSCSKKEKKPPYQPPQNAVHLITGDSTKTWKLAKRYNGKTRMNMGDCFLGYRQTFGNDGLVADNNSELTNCGESLTGRWNIIKDSSGYTYIRIESPDIPELMNIEESFKDFRIFYLSKDSLHLSFEHTQFGEKRRISDYFVQEAIEVSDRNFHH